MTVGMHRARAHTRRVGTGEDAASHVVKMSSITLSRDAFFDGLRPPLPTG